MSALATLKSQIMALPDAPEVSKETMAKYAGKQWGSFLPFVRVLTFTSGPVKHGGQKAGTLVLEENKSLSRIPEGEDGGPPIVMVNCSSRAKAIDLRDKENPKINFDPESPEFADLYQISKQQGLNNVLAGIEFLVWIPSVNKFATFFFYNKTLLGVSEKMKEAKGKVIGINARYCKNDQGEWYGISIDDNYAGDLSAVPGEGALDKAMAEFKQSSGQASY